MLVDFLLVFRVPHFRVLYGVWVSMAGALLILLGGGLETVLVWRRGAVKTQT
jgi:hypothetical protein